MPNGEHSMDSNSSSLSTHAGLPLTPETSKRRPHDPRESGPDGTAIPDDTVQRYYYVYDSREGRTIVHDRRTRAAYDWLTDPRVPLLDHLAQQIETRIEALTRASVRVRQMYRRFALWCASTVIGADAGSGVNGDKQDSDEENATPAAFAYTALLHAARTFDELAIGPQTDSAKRLRESGSAGRVRERYENEVIHAATIGLSEMDPVAARLLTAHCATDPDARRAAVEAGHMSERYAEFVAYQKHAATQKHADTAERYAPAGRTSHTTADIRASWSNAAKAPSSPDAAVRLMREAQIDWCLDKQLGMPDA